MTGAPEPKPCKRFAKRFALNDRLLAHVPDCDACRATVLYLVNESDKLMRARRRRVRLRVSSSTTWEFSQDGLCEQQHPYRLKIPPAINRLEILLGSIPSHGFNAPMYAPTTYETNRAIKSEETPPTGAKSLPPVGDETSAESRAFREAQGA